MGQPFDSEFFRQLEAAGIGGRVRKVNNAAATQALTAGQSGEVFRAAVDAVFTLPASGPTLKGVFYKFITGALSAGTGLSISPNAADGIGGAGLTSVVNKDLINTGATDTLTDFVVIRCTGEVGAGAWVIEDISGIWAKEA